LFSLSIPFRRSLSIAVQTKNDFAVPTVCIERDYLMGLKGRLVAPLLFVFLLLTSCASAYLAELEPPAQYDHPYDGPLDERAMSVSEVRTLCMSMGAFGVACAWMSDDGTCHIVLPNDYQGPVSIYRRHETAHCNGWPADHPRDG
jgi:hypothetical protein